MANRKPEATQLIEPKAKYGLACVIDICFTRGVEGLKSSRVVFGRARKTGWTLWEVYATSGTYLLFCSCITFH